MGGGHRHVSLDGAVSLKNYIAQVLDLTQLAALAGQVESA
jgi:hypothetical protein